MLGRTRRPPTDRECTITLVGPESAKYRLVQSARKQGFSVVEDEERMLSFPEGLGHDRGSLPGECLRGARLKEGFTQRDLAESAGLSRHHISEMEHGKRPIGKDVARRLAQSLNVDYRIFL
ncbi:MAG: helix-turn-helix domain-containing protein [Synergistales bacterium]|nr:helix-turn-helix domain-containing protein [Synergistales bacterium]